VGRRAYLGPGVFVDLLYPDLVTVGDYASVGMNAMVFAQSDPTYSKLVKEKFYPRKVAPVLIKEGVWIAPRQW
jgi:acetyltransferase-like isoleucine patch superfamily enzyme